MRLGTWNQEDSGGTEVEYCEQPNVLFVLSYGLIKTGGTFMLLSSAAVWACVPSSFSSSSFSASVLQTAASGAAGGKNILACVEADIWTYQTWTCVRPHGSWVCLPAASWLCSSSTLNCLLCSLSSPPSPLSQQKIGKITGNRWALNSCWGLTEWAFSLFKTILL